MARHAMLVQFLKALERAPGITVIDPESLVLRVRAGDGRVVRVTVAETGLLATARRVARDRRFSGLAGADPTSRSVTLFLLELQAALQDPSSRAVACFFYTERGMVPDQLRTGILPA